VERPCHQPRRKEIAFLRQYDDKIRETCGKFHGPQHLASNSAAIFRAARPAAPEPSAGPLVAWHHSANPAEVSPQEGWPSSFEGARLNAMTDPREAQSLAEHGAIPRDLPSPPPLATLSSSTDPVALFLDFDGTLVEIADDPHGVHVPASLPALIADLNARLEGRFAVVTGRSLEALEAMLGPLEVAVAGSHGGEFRQAGSREVTPLAQPLPGAVTKRLSDFAKDHGGLLVEPKPFSIAVHYRRHPEALAALVACADETGAAFGLKLKHGKQVIELAMPGSDKGSAVERFMQGPPFAGACPLFIGDDVTDEDAFAAVTRLGGAGILVGPVRETHARWRLESVSAVHAWLAADRSSTPNSHKENSPA